MQIEKTSIDYLEVALVIGSIIPGCWGAWLSDRLAATISTHANPVATVAPIAIGLQQKLCQQLPVRNSQNSDGFVNNNLIFFHIGNAYSV